MIRALLIVMSIGRTIHLYSVEIGKHVINSNPESVRLFRRIKSFPFYAEYI